MVFLAPDFLSEANKYFYVCAFSVFFNTAYILYFSSLIAYHLQRCENAEVNLFIFFAKKKKRI